MNAKARKTASLRIKSAEATDDLGTFSGYASIFDNRDSFGDVVRRGAFTETLAEWAASGNTIPVLWGHDFADPFSNIGHVTDAVEDDRGLLISGQLDLENPKAAQVFGLIKGRRVSQMSFAFDVLDGEFIPADDASEAIYEIRRVKLYEVSIVPIGANQETEILATKAAPDFLVPAGEALELYLAAKSGAPLNLNSSEGATLTMTNRSIAAKQDAARAARDAILRTAAEAGRGLTAAEAADLRVKSAEVDRWDAAQADAEKNEEITRRLKGLSLGSDAPDRDGARGRGAATKSAGSQRIAASVGELRELAADVAGQLHTKAAGDATGVVTSGSLVASSMAPDVVEAPGDRAVTLLEAIGVELTQTPAFSYIRQTSRENRAAVVPTGEKKPTSDYGFERVDDNLVVIAHLSGGVDQFILSDVTALTAFIEQEMAVGVNQAVEAELVAALNAAPGVGTQPFIEDRLTTVRASLTKLQRLGLAPGVIAMSPEDWERIELSKTSGSGQFVFGSTPVNSIEQSLWGTPVAVTTALNAGEAWLLDSGAARVKSDGKLGIAWHASGEQFEKNEIQLRVEGRYKPAIYRPAGALKLALTSGAEG